MRKLWLWWISVFHNTGIMLCAAQRLAYLVHNINPPISIEEWVTTITSGFPNLRKGRFTGKRWGWPSGTCR